jgi:hypothetical protein
MGGLPKEMLPQGTELVIGSLGRAARQRQGLSRLGALGRDLLQHLRQGGPPLQGLQP